MSPAATPVLDGANNRYSLPTCDEPENDHSLATITAVPDSGYEFTGWTGPGVPSGMSNDNPLVVHMNQSRTLCPVFAQVATPCTMELTVVPGASDGVVTIQALDSVNDPVGDPIVFGPESTGYPIFSGEFDCDTQLKLTPQPEEGWYFKEWGGPDAADVIEDVSKNFYTIVVDEDKKISAEFDELFTLTLVVEGDGVVRMTENDAIPVDHATGFGPVEYPADTLFTLKPFSVAGNEFSGWTGAIVTTSSETQNLALTEDKVVTAHFESANIAPEISLNHSIIDDYECGGVPLSSIISTTVSDVDEPGGGPSLPVTITVIDESGASRTITDAQSTPGTYTVTYTVVDSRGASASAELALEVVDTTAPIFAFDLELSGATITVNRVPVANPVPVFTPPTATATDACSGVVPVTISGAGAVNLNVEGIYTVGYAALDAEGNEATFDLTVVVDDAPPVVTLNGSATMLVKLGTAFSDPGATAADLIDGSLPVSVSGTVDTSTEGAYTLSYSATDSNGQIDTKTRVVTVSIDNPPVIYGAVDITIQYSAPYNDSDIYAVDDFTSDALVTERLYISQGSIAQLSEGKHQKGEYLLEYRTFDEANNSATAERTVTVVDTTPPVITLIGPATVNVDAGEGTYTEFVDGAYTGAYAVDGYDGAVSVTSDLTALDTTEPGVYFITYSAEDAEENNATATRIVRVGANDPPVITLNGDASVTLPFGSNYTEPDPGATAEDSVDGDLTDYIVVTGLSAAIAGGPGVYEIDYDVEDFDGNPATTVTRTVTKQAPTPKTLTVTRPINGAITLTPPDPAEVVDGGSDATEVFNYAHNTLVYARAIPDSGYIFAGWGGDLSAGGRIARFEDAFNVSPVDEDWTLLTGTWTIESGYLKQGTSGTAIGRANAFADMEFRFSYRRAAGNNDLTVVLRDDVGGDTLALVIGAGDLTLVETINSIPTVLEDNLAAASVEDVWYDIFVEADGAVARVWRRSGTANFDLVLSTDAAQVLNTETLRVETATGGEYHLDSFDQKSLLREGVVTLNQNRSISATFRAVDTLDPVITLIGANPLTHQCGAVFNDPGVSVTDAVYGSLETSVVFAGDIIDANTDPGEYEIIYRVTDPEGNTAELTRDVEVVDTTIPVITLTGDAHVYLALNTYQYIDAGATATDGCDGEVDVAVDASEIELDEFGDNTVTYTAVDSSGNHATPVERTVSVAPTLTIVVVDGGRVEPGGGGAPVFYDYGTSVPVRAIPEAAFDHWMGGGFDNETDAAITAVMTESRHLTAYFKPMASFGPGVLSFDEDEGVVQIPVKLSRVSTQNTTLEYEVTGGTARYGLDFTHPAGAVFVEWHDDFSASDLAGWTGDSTWSGQKGYLENSASSLATIARTQAEGDFDLYLKYRTDRTNRTEIVLRKNGGDSLALVVSPSGNEWSLRETVSSVNNTLATTSSVTSAAVWYDVFVAADGPSIEVWRKISGSTDPYIQILGPTTVSIEDTEALEIASALGTRFDDFRLEPPLGKGEVTIPSGQSNGVIAFEINDDAADEPTEDVEVTLTGGSTGFVEPSVKSWSILDNDAAPEVEFETDASSKSESGGVHRVKVVVSEKSGHAITMNYSVSGTAGGSGVDFVTPSGTVTLSPKSGTGYIDITLVDDEIQAAPGTIILTLTGATPATLGDQVTHTITILDDDFLVHFNTAKTAVSESVGTVTVDVELPVASTNTVQVEYYVSAGTTASGSGEDYTLEAGTLVFAPSDQTETISVAIESDTVSEALEKIEISLRDPVNARIGSPRVHTIEISDDDAIPSVGFSEGESSFGEAAGLITIPLELSNASAVPVALTYVVTSGATAVGGGADYEFLDSGDISIPAGEDGTAISVRIYDDAYDEPNEAFTMELINPVNATVDAGARFHTLEIVDNDGAPTVSIVAPGGAHLENNGDTSFDLVLSARTNVDVTATFAVVGGTATSGADYTLSGGTVTIVAGTLSHRVRVPIVNDTIDEETESILVALTGATAATVSTSQAQAKILIQDDDQAPSVRFATPTNSVLENVGESGATVLLSAPSERTVVVPFVIEDISTTFELDYHVGNAQVRDWSDDFNDGNSDGWSIRAGAWTAANAVLTPVGTAGEVVHHFFADNFEFRFAYRRVAGDEEASLVLSENISDPNADAMRLAFAEESLQLFNTVSETEVAVSDATTVPGEGEVWYEITIRRESDRVRVYQRERGTTEAPTLYLDVEDVLLGSLDGLALDSDLGIAYDDFVAYRPGDHPNRGQLVFTPGQTQSEVRVAVEDDEYYELDESLVARLENPVQATLDETKSTHTVTIQDNEDFPIVEFDEATSSSLESVGTHSLPVTLVPPAGTEVWIDYEYTGGAAVDRIDFTDAHTPAMLQWSDDFTDLDLAGWAAITGWSVANGYLENISASTAIIHANTQADYQLTFKLDAGATGTSAVRLRSGAAGESLDLYVDMATGMWRLAETNSSGTTVLSEAEMSAISGWSDIYIGCVGPTVEVWRRSASSNGPMQKVLKTGSATILMAGDFPFAGSVGVKFDGIRAYLPVAVPTAAPLFTDDFEDGDIVGWTVRNPAWTATNRYLETIPIVSGDNWGSIARPFNHTDIDFLFSYYYPSHIGTTIDVVLRENAGVYVGVRLSGFRTDLFEKTSLGVVRRYIAGSGPTASVGVWHDLLVRCKGDLLQVWRREHGVSGAYEKLVEGTTQVLTSGKQFAIAQGPDVRIDDVRAYAGDTLALTNFRTAGTLFFPAYTSTTPIELIVSDDVSDEINETAVFELYNPHNAALGLAEHTFTIIDNDVTPSVSYGTSATVNRAENGGHFVITARLSEATGNPVPVTFTIGGTATLGVDYTVSNPGSFTYGPGVINHNLTITPINDNVLEEDESIVLTLQPIVENAVLGTHVSRTIMLTNDDLPEASFVLSKSEWEEHEGPALLEVKLSGPYTATAKVNYSVTGGTATDSGVDYTLAAGELTFTAGATSEFIEIDLEDDLVSDPGETIEVTITAGANTVIGSPSMHEVTLLDALNDVHFDEAASGFTEPSTTTAVNIPVVLESAAAGGETVDYEVLVESTAEEGDDYTLTAGTLTFAMSDTEKDIVIDLHGDAIYEIAETVVIELSNASSTLLLKPPFRHTLTINPDSDPAPEIQFVLASSEETEADDTVEIALVLAETEVDASVSYAVGVGSTADAGEDFILLGTGVIEVPSGEQPDPIEITLVDDMIAEEDEEIVLVLSAPVGASLGANDEHTLTISDNDIAYSFAEASSAHGETAGTVEIPVTLSGPSVGESRVGYLVSLGAENPATSGEDFSPLGAGELVFANGETEPDEALALTILDDTLLEEDETLVITLSNPNLLTVGDGEHSIHTVVIEDNEVGVAFVEAYSQVGENVEGGVFEIPVTVTEAFTGTVEVAVVTAGTTATAEDYELETAVLTFSDAGVTTQYVELSILSDTLNEDLEEILLKISSPDPAPLVLGETVEHLVYLLDDDAEPTIGFDAVVSSVVEDDTTVQIPVSLSAPSARNIQVRYTVSDGTAISAPPNADYLAQPATGVLEFPLGTQTQHIAITIIGDSRREYPDETLSIALSEPLNAIAGDMAHILTIQDNDMGVFFDAAESETFESGSGAHLISVKLTEPSVGETRITYHVDGSSTASPTSGPTSPQDYTLAPAVGDAIVFADGLSEAFITLTTQNDIWFEDQEAVVLKLSGASPNTVGVDESRATHTVRITSNDAQPVLGFVANAAAEVGEANSPVNVSVGLSRPSQRVVKAAYATADGTATAPTDYTAAIGQLVFQPGQTEKTLPITIIDDTAVEDAETFDITLSDLENATAGDLSHTVTIVDNEYAVAFGEASATVEEDAGSHAVLVEVGSPVSGSAVTVQYRVVIESSTATHGVDYTLTNGTLTIPVGSTTPTVPLVVGIVEDTYEESNETVVIELYNPSNAGLGLPKVFTLTIQDNDTASPNNPDLAVSDITSPLEGVLIKAGDALVPEFTLANPGGMVSGGAVSVYLSQHETLASGPARLLGREVLAPLNAGESRNESVPLEPIPDVAPGSYHIIVHVAPESGHADENTANNETSVEIVVIDKVLTNE